MDTIHQNPMQCAETLESKLIQYFIQNNIIYPYYMGNDKLKIKRLWYCDRNDKHNSK